MPARDKRRRPTQLCPLCRAPLELVPDGAIVTKCFVSVKRTPHHPTGVKFLRTERHVPFLACTRCEYCAALD